MTSLALLLYFHSEHIKECSSLLCVHLCLYRHRDEYYFIHPKIDNKMFFVQSNGDLLLYSSHTSNLCHSYTIFSCIRGNSFSRNDDFWSNPIQILTGFNISRLMANSSKIGVVLGPIKTEYYWKMAVFLASMLQSAYKLVNKF